LTVSGANGGAWPMRRAGLVPWGVVPAGGDAGLAVEFSFAAGFVGFYVQMRESQDGESGGWGAATV